jgi:diguanylate cyclase (GGDEF)-like protein/PAS domain S-box-containing protein
MLMVSGFTVMKKAEQRIESVVREHNEKTELIIAMRTVARERAFSMSKMLIIQDPIEVTDEMEHFSFLASDFIKAREKLESLPFTENEKKLHNNLMRIVKKGAPAQIEIAQLIEAGQHTVAREKLLNEILPLQQSIFMLISKMIELQKKAANDAVSESKKDYLKAVVILGVISLIIGIITIRISQRIIQHITFSETVISNQKERAQATLHSIADAVITTNNEGKLEQINSAAEKMLDVDDEEITGKYLKGYVTIINEFERECSIDPISDSLTKKKVITSSGNEILMTMNGTKFGIEFTASPIYDLEGSLTGSVLVIKDVTHLRILSNELAYHARHDNLTGLLNRRELENRLEQTLKEVRLYENTQACLCFLDLDQFKVINDTCGHTAGDELLKQIADVLTSTTRESDIVARMGGDEFTVILNYCDEQTACKIMERARVELQALNLCWDDKCFNASVSIGIVPITQSSGSVKDLMMVADAACYVAKEEGRNRVHLYSSDDNKTIEKRGEMEWAHRIRHAIEQQRFVMYYQTIKALPKGNQALHGEILIRLLDEENKPVPPLSFLPAAERYNLMPDIDKYVIRHTLSELNNFFNYSMIADGLFSINLSAQSLCEEGFLDFVVTQLANFKLRPSNICFEITETAMISNMSNAIHFITMLKEQGCKFALDDFGSGLSSFGYLKNLPVDYLKIDGSFVKEINNDRLDHAMVSSMNNIGHIIGIETIAEFVEDGAIEATLTSIGVDYAQGYGIDKPSPFKDILDKVATNKKNIITQTSLPKSAL